MNDGTREEPVPVTPPVSTAAGAQATPGTSGPAPGTSGPAPSPGRPAHVMDPLERTVQRVLLAGVVVSVVLLAVGLALAVASGGELTPGVVSLRELGAGLAAMESAAYLSLGLLVLIATPFVRVAGSLLAFARLRDRRYVLVTAAVLAIMCVSVLIGTA